MMTPKPNILLFFPDQHRGDWTELNTALPIRTPNLKKIADKGIHFSNCVTPAPVCSPARTCMAGGREYDHSAIISNGQNHPEEEITFYKLLQQAGYYTMGCGKFDLNKPVHNKGKDGKQKVNGKDYFQIWGFSDGIDNGGKGDSVRIYTSRKGCNEPYTQFLKKEGVVKKHVIDFARRKFDTIRPTPLNENHYADNWIGQNGLDLIRSVPEGKPWFLQVNFNGPHAPLDVTKRMRKQWKDVNFPPLAECTRFKPKHQVEIQQNYSAMVENIDRWVGIYLKELEKRGELENTLIVYASDHGEMLGNHNLNGKSVPYQPSMGVPLFIQGPGVKHQPTLDNPMTLVDLAATFLDYGGKLVPDEMDSLTLRPLLEGKREEHRKVVRSGLYNWRLAFNGRYKLIKGFKPKTKGKGKYRFGKTPKMLREDPVLLFDLQTDPWETQNIASQHPEIVEQLSLWLNSDYNNN
jgi:arylsulfatase A-like enzyme